MTITPERKQTVISEYATKPGDTGSPEVQVAVLSERITNLTEHFKLHGKDNHSRRGLIKMVSQRRRLLDYVKASDAKRYEALIARLGSEALSTTMAPAGSGQHPRGSARKLSGSNLIRAGVHSHARASTHSLGWLREDGPSAHRRHGQK